MKIIKRNGAEVPFDITKIITAVTKASDSVGGQAAYTIRNHMERNFGLA